jgi:AraC family transcriptional regulator
MEPRFIERSEMTIVGMVFYGDPFHASGVTPEQNEVGKLWTRFSAYWDRHRGDFRRVIDERVGWELHIATQEYEETKAYFVMVGMEVSGIEDLPGPIFAKVLPAGTYAVFTLRGREMTDDWSDAIYLDWLPSSDYEEAIGCTLERYDEARFRGWGEPDSEIEVWVPVRARSG